MAVALTGSGGLFTILGTIFHAQATLNTARGSTVPSEVLDAIDAFEALPNTLATQAVIAGLENSATTWSNNNTLMSSLQNFAENVIVRMVSDDVDLTREDFENAFAELVSQMIGAGSVANPDNDVDASTATVSVSSGSNTGDGVLLATATRGNGRNIENAMSEAIAVTVNNGSLSLVGEEAEADKLSHRWPQGSGLTSSLTPSASSLLNNGGFDDEDDRTNAPDDWIIETGTVGVTLKMTAPEVQTVIISGDPTTGNYTLTYTDAVGNQQTTTPLAFNASQATLQSALRNLAGLGTITVTTTGTGPNYTHTITFNGVAGNIGNLSSATSFDTGSIAHAQVSAGGEHTYIGKAVEFDADGAELTELRQLVSLAAETPYAFNAYMKADLFPATGELKIELVDGTGTVINDSQGTANVITVDPTSGGDLSTSAFTAINGFFRLPANVPDFVYLRIRMSTAVSSGTSIFIDEAKLLAATELYGGGPFVAVVPGAIAFAASDVWTINVTNDRAGQFQEWFHRNFELNGALLPSNSSGSETINDTLVG